MIHSADEYSPLREIIVGSADNAHWPQKCAAFRGLEQTSGWQETAVPSGPVEQHVIDAANRDLDTLSSTLENLGVTVHRPLPLDFASFDGMYNYCPRDRVLIVDDRAIDAPMLYPTRKPEIDAFKHLLDCEIIAPPAGHPAQFDAANVCRLGKDLLYLVSSSGNVAGAEWLQRTLGTDYTVHVLQNIYSGVHIDSTISIVRPGLAVLNADRINKDNTPDPLRSWDIIWLSKHELATHSFYNYPYASNYIALNFLTVDPHTVICDPKQTRLREELEKRNVTTIGVDLSQSRTLGGGHHCVTLDLHRE